MSSFPYCQQLLCRQPQIDPMGLKGTYSKINHLTRSYITYLGLKSHGCTPKSHFFRPLLLSGGVLKLSRNQDSMETEREWEVLIFTEGFDQDIFNLFCLRMVLVIWVLFKGQSWSHSPLSSKHDGRFGIKVHLLSYNIRTHSRNLPSSILKLINTW